MSLSMLFPLVISEFSIVQQLLQLSKFLLQLDKLRLQFCMYQLLMYTNIIDVCTDSNTYNLSATLREV